MTELVIGLLGSGVLAQLVQTLLTMRQSRRQLEAVALGSEVDALEKTIRVLADNFELQAQRHREETDRLRARIATLEAQILELRNFPNFTNSQTNTQL